MPDLTAKRTLVKSPPELWSEVSDLERLARHLGAFGEIKITKLEPEHTVAWEGEAASGTVSIEPSGWGTKVTLTAQLGEEEAVEAEPPAPEPIAIEEEPEAVVEEPEPAPEAEPSAEPLVSPEPPRKRGFLAWLFRPRSLAQEPPLVEPEAVREEPVVELPPEPEPEPEPEPVAASPEPLPEPEPEAIATGSDPEPTSSPALDAEHAQAILDDALEALGSAHHRPFSRG